ncbi:hypothetical protein ACIA8F_23905 [Streptomyces sp. NPDC051563]|uniref:hypothetical protein n=1 Tax=unclassified Streptomyces TaxID=2593676 RepID=UPI0037945679
MGAAAGFGEGTCVRARPGTRARPGCPRPGARARPGCLRSGSGSGSAAVAVVVVSEDARRYWGPLTEGLALPADLDLDLDLGVRDRALDQLGVRPSVHARIVPTVKDVLGERDGRLLVGVRPWPLLAARMQQIGEAHGPAAVAERLARLTGDESWRTGPPGEYARRMVLSTHQALTTPPGTPLVAAPPVSAAAARSRSTTTLAAAPGTAGAAPDGPAMSAHRQQAAPARKSGRGR